MADMWSLDDARRRLLEALLPMQEGRWCTPVAAVGCALTNAVSARVDLPPVDNSSMDGYALAVTESDADIPEGSEFRVTQTVMAGDVSTQGLRPGEAARIMTGAMIPPGTSTVAMQENMSVLSDHRVRLNKTMSHQDNIRRQGEDISAGSPLANVGDVISVPLAALLAAQGIEQVEVHRPVRVGLLATGDELRDAGQTLEPGQIYESNRAAVSGLLRGLPVELHDLGIQPDDESELIRVLEAAGATCDVVVSTGGVSVGERDYTRQILEQCGEVSFWKVAMKPGKPLAFGRLFGAWFFGLPGNPVSALVTARLFLVPAIQRLAGLAPEPPFTLSARASRPFRKRPGRADFQRANLTRARDGQWEIAPVSGQGSHQLAAFASANAFCCLPADSVGVETGDWVEAMPFGTLLTGQA